MAKTGLNATDRRRLNRLRRLLAFEVVGNRQIKTGELSYLNHLRIYGELTRVMQHINADSTLLPLIKAERLIIGYDLDECSSQKYALDAYKKAASDLEEMEEKTNHIAHAPNRFHQTMYVGLRQADRKNGLPIDGMRKLIASHETRIRNLYFGRNRDPEEQQKYLDQRMECARNMKRIYIAQQKACLGV